MKLIGKTLNYITRSTESTGMWSEKIVCNILRIPFNSKRKYLTDSNYPLELRKDIEQFEPYIKKLNISEHLGNKNEYYDFKTTDGSTVSLKTNISGGKVCPQNIGQTSLVKFNEKTSLDLQTITEYKSMILSDTTEMINLYLVNLFCCEHLLSFKFDQGKFFHFQKIGNVSLNDPVVFRSSKDLTTWKNSNSLSINFEGDTKPLCEFQIHGSRNCIQCRFNLDTIVLLVKNKMIKNVTLKTFDLTHKYNIKVSKVQFDEIESKQTESKQTEEFNVHSNKKRKLN